MVGIYDDNELVLLCELNPGDGVPKEIWPELSKLLPINSKCESGDGSPASLCTYLDAEGREWDLKMSLDGGGFIYWLDLC